jgi:hypothetical protein
MPDPQQPTLDQKIAAQEQHLGRLSHKVDTLTADALMRRVESRADAVDPGAVPDDDRYKALHDDVAELKRMFGDFLKRDAEAKEGEQERREGEPEETAADEDPHFEGKPEWAENPHQRGDSRADAARRRREDELDLYEAQSQFNEAYMAVEGKKAPDPVSGHSALTYRVYAAKPLQKYCETWKSADLLKLAKSSPDVFRVADTAIRADCIRIGGDSRELAKYKTDGVMQREIRRTDRTGRVISEFVGPVMAPNGMFAPFDLPPKKFRNFNRNPNHYD